MVSGPGYEVVHVGWLPWENVGTVFVALSTVGVIGVDLGQLEFETFAQALQTRVGVLALEDHSIAQPAVLQLHEYFLGKRKVFDLPIDYRGQTPFRQAVLKLTAEIPCGSMETYQGIAQKLGNPNAVRAVGQALAQNPIPIIVPCHRVVGSDMSMVGYSASGGIETKLALLQLEKALLL